MRNGGVVVKLLACEARGPVFDSRSRRYDFRDWLSPASKSRYGNIAKAMLIPKTTNQLSLVLYSATPNKGLLHHLQWPKSGSFTVSDDLYYIVQYS